MGGNPLYLDRSGLMHAQFEHKDPELNIEIICFTTKGDADLQSCGISDIVIVTDVDIVCEANCKTCDSK
jgi:hypothetical protein